MKYQIILQSRSFNHDYRWIKTSSFLERKELDALEKMFLSYKDAYFDVFALHQSKPLYLVRFSRASVLIQGTHTGFEDVGSRDVLAFQGVCVPHDYQRQFWFVLPFVLNGFDKFFNFWGELDRKSADGKVELIDERELRLSDYDRPIKSWATPLPHGKDDGLTKLPFTSSGFAELIRIVAHPDSAFTTFLFGSTSTMLKIVGVADIIASASEEKNDIVEHSKARHNGDVKQQISPTVEVMLTPSQTESARESAADSENHPKSIKEQVPVPDQESDKSSASSTPQSAYNNFNHMMSRYGNDEIEDVPKAEINSRSTERGNSGGLLSALIKSLFG